MNKIENLKDWQLDKGFSNAERRADIEVWLRYPDERQFIEFKPKERIRKIDQDHKEKLNRLSALNILEKVEVTGTKKRPRGVRASIKYDSLRQLSKLDFIKGISIISIKHAVNIKNEDQTPHSEYFCVKMTVVIEIEGLSSKKQSIEKRFVLIKATSPDEAYEKLEKTKDEYAAPYLNSDGRFVRWRIESFDDCYSTGITKLKDLDNPEGAEVFSKLGSRKNKSRTAWDAK